jgi:limonene-1,2-epoxide hydrolase
MTNTFLRTTCAGFAVSVMMALAPPLASAATASGTVAVSTNAREADNIAVVKSFADSWNDADKAVEFLADNATVSMEEDKPPVVGKPAYLAAMKAYAAQGGTASIKAAHFFARGPVVVMHRTDVIHVEGKPDASYELVGVFVVKNGKIAVWNDYMVK